MQNNDNNVPDDQDFEYLRENLKIENLNCDYFHNLVTNPKVESLIDNYLEEALGKKLNKNSLQNTFYLACFWGYKNVCRTLMDTYPELNINHANGSKWTPLHAAAFMENGPIVMLLLSKGADMNAPDKYERTPADFASASEIVWPHFAVHKLKRLNKNELIEKQIASRTQIINRQNGGNYARFNQIKFAPYQVSKNNLVNNESFNIAYANGDVLASNNCDDHDSAIDDLKTSLQMHDNKQQQSNFNLW